MSETRANGEIVGGIPLFSPDEIAISQANAERVGRRSAAAALALQLQQTSASTLDRFGVRRQVGGTFERIQEEPARQASTPSGLGIQDLQTFLSAFDFSPRSEELSSRQFFSSFGPSILGLARDFEGITQ